MQIFFIDYQSSCRSKRKVQKTMAASRLILEKLEHTTATLKKTKSAYNTRFNEQNARYKNLLTSIKYLL